RRRARPRDRSRRRSTTPAAPGSPMVGGAHRMAEILYRDEALIAVAKPAGRLVIPGRDGREPALRDELGAELGCRLFVGHRRAGGASGVLLSALPAAAHRTLSMAFERHAVDKRYWALCAGLVLGSGEIDRALVPIRGGRVRAARPGEAGKPSRSRY